MNLILNNFFLTFLCVISIAFIIFMIAFFILEIIMRNKEVDNYIEEKNIKDLVKEFHQKLDIVNSQDTDEILECLKEMEKLDNIYYYMIDKNHIFMGEEEFIKVKNDILNRIIDNKIKSIEKEKNKKEKYKSLIDEIKACNKRYPLYKNTFFDKIKTIEKK